MGRPVLPVLYGGLESTNDSIRNGAIQTIGLIGSKMSVPYLLDPAFDPAQPAGIRSRAGLLARIMGIPTDKGDGVSPFGAARELKKLAKDCLANRVVWPTLEGKTDLWTWSEEAKSVVRNKVPPVIASLYTGLQFAHQAISMRPKIATPKFCSWHSSLPGMLRVRKRVARNNSRQLLRLGRVAFTISP